MGKYYYECEIPVIGDAFIDKSGFVNADSYRQAIKQIKDIMGEDPRDLSVQLVN